MLSKEKVLSLLTNQSLELIILPTEQCNFRCVYCYEDFSIGKMRAHTVEAIKKLISTRIATLNTLKISWFGGEPLAAKEIVFAISAYILQLRVSHPQVNYVATMTTNGYQLTDDVLQKMLACGISSYQISLDGNEVAHDRTRKRSDGAGTFQKIWRNLLAALASDGDFSIILRLHVSPTNLNEMYELIDQIKEKFSHDKRFALFIKPIENLGGPNAGSFNVFGYHDKSTVLADLYRHIGSGMRVIGLDDQGPYVCYSAMTNSFVIRADGKIAKCTVALNDDRNILGELSDDGSISIANDKLALWARGIKTQDLSALRCPLYQLPTLEMPA